MIMLRATSLPSWTPVPRLAGDAGSRLSFRVFTAATVAVCPNRVKLDAMRLALAVIGCLFVVSGPAAADEMRIATLAPSGSPWMETLERAASEIAAKTDKRVTVKYYGGGQQGDERDFVRKIKLGQLDGAAVTSMGLAMIDPSILVLQLPLLFQSEDEVDYVAGKMWPYFQKKFEQKGFRLAERGEVGWIYFFSKNKVESVADLRKQKLWSWGNDDLGGKMLDRLSSRASRSAFPRSMPR
jgi:TRAP-type C4-dicarboxylate transport system substrate-binding protein